MNDINLPSGMGVWFGAIVTLEISVVLFFVALIAAGLVRKGPDTRVLKRLARFEAGALACAGCGCVYVGIAAAGGQRLLGILDFHFVDGPIIAVAVGATVSFAVETTVRLRRLSHPKGWAVAVAAGVAGAVAVLVAFIGKTLVPEDGFGLPTLALGLGSCAFVTIGLVGALALIFRR